MASKKDVAGKRFFDVGFNMGSLGIEHSPDLFSDRMERTMWGSPRAAFLAGLQQGQEIREAGSSLKEYIKTHSTQIRQHAQEELNARQNDVNAQAEWAKHMALEENHAKGVYLHGNDSHPTDELAQDKMIVHQLSGIPSIQEYVITREFQEIVESMQ